MSEESFEITETSSATKQLIIEEFEEEHKSRFKLPIIIVSILSVIVGVSFIGGVHELSYDVEKWHEKAEKATTYKEKIRCLNRAVKCNNLYAPSYNARGFVHLENGNFNKAMRDFNFIINHEVNDMPSMLGRAITNDSLGNYEEAKRDFAKAINMNGKDPYAHYFRAAFFHRHEKYEKAYKDIKKAVMLDPTNQQFLSARDDIQLMVEGKPLQNET